MGISVGSSTNAQASREVRDDAPVSAAQAQQVSEATQTPPALQQTTSGFEASAPAGTSSAPASAPVDPTVAAARSPELITLVGEPSSLKTDTVVRPETKLDTIVQAAKPEERAAVRAHFAQAEAQDVNAAFDNVLSATTQQGTRPVVLGPFVGKVTVEANGDVNGAALASDREVRAAAALVHVSQEDKRAELKQVGVDEAWVDIANPAELTQAFMDVEMRRQFGPPGPASVTHLEQRSADESVWTEPVSTSFTVTADGSLIGPSGTAERPASEAGLANLRARESAEWPGGTPEAREKSRIEETFLAVPTSEKVATLLAVVPPETAGALRKLVDTPPGVTAQSIDESYLSVLQARQTPGKKDIDISLTPLELRTASLGEGEERTYTVEQAPRSFSATLEVSADGKVNGKQLEVDELARLGSQLSTIPADVKRKALLEAGLSSDWLNTASLDQCDFALAKLRLASTQPGEHQLDFSYDYEAWEGGDAATSVTRRLDGALTVHVDADGKVDGKTPLIDTALATQLTFERMSMGEKRLLLAQTGFPADACRTVRPDEAASILTQIAVATREPGEHSLAVDVDGAPWVLGLKIGANGDIEAAGAQKVPPDPPLWKQVAGPVLAIIGAAFPPLFPVTSMLNAALAISNGATGLGLVGALVSMAGGMSGLGDMASGLAGASAATKMLVDVANTINATNGVYQGVKSGNLLGAFSSAISLAESVGVLGKFELGSSFDLLKTAGQVAGIANKVQHGDVFGLIADGVVQGIRDTKPAATQADVRRIDNELEAKGLVDAAMPTGTDYSLGPAHFGETNDGPRLGTGDDGSSIDVGTAGGGPGIASDAATPTPLFDEPPADEAPSGIRPSSGRDVPGVGSERRTHTAQGGWIFGAVTDSVVDARGASLGVKEVPLRSGNVDVTSQVANATIAPNSFDQGGLGNCFLVASLKEVALIQPGLLDKNMTFESDGSVTVRLFDRNGAPVTVKLDAAVPDGSDSVMPVKISPELSAAGAKAYLYQKALVAAYPQLQRSTAPTYSADYSSVASGGWPHEVLSFATGARSDVLMVDGGSTPQTVGGSLLRNTQTAVSELFERVVGRPVVLAQGSMAQVFDTIFANQIAGRLMVADTNSFVLGENQRFGTLPQGVNDSSGLLGVHAYAVVGAYTDEGGRKMVRIMEPNAYYEKTSGPVLDRTLPAADGVRDGIQSITLEEFFTKFRFLYVNRGGG